MRYGLTSGRLRRSIWTLLACAMSLKCPLFGAIALSLHFENKREQRPQKGRILRRKRLLLHYFRVPEVGLEPTRPGAQETDLRHDRV